MSNPFEIADRLTEDYCDLSPINATFAGVPGRDHLWDDLSPEGEQARASLARGALTDLAEFMDHPDPVQRHAARVIQGWALKRVEKFDRGEWQSDLNHLASPLHGVRHAFDLLDHDDKEAWAAAEERLRTTSEPLSGYRQSLEVGLAEGNVAARRQVESVIAQTQVVANGESEFSSFGEKAAAAEADGDAVAAAVAQAESAFGELGDWLEAVYLPNARAEDAVGRERYLVAADDFLGMSIDPEETYQWGWDEVHRLMSEMKATAKEIDPTLSIGEVIELLDTDPERSAPDHESFAEFVQGIQDTAVSQLSGTHFDVPEELKKVSVRIAPPGGALGAWYNAPSEDFSRPGSIWYAPGERTRIPYWQEVSTAYHEGFPGHHLQVGIAVMQKEKLSRFHRLFVWYSGSGEGWALYAERLMDELGYFEKPEYRLGLLSSQLFRATRVVVDIGTQLKLMIPEHGPLHAGDPWNYANAVDYMEKIGLQARDVAESEVKRYLGWWGQAISYKVGEREILSIREDARESQGSNFDLKAFHQKMLEAGGIRLDYLREVMI